VSVDSKLIGEIGTGLLVLLGIGTDDTEADVFFLADKIIGLRIFEDDQEKMNLGLKDVNGSILVVSQFTLQGDCRKGRRPSFVGAAKAEVAKNLYEKFVQLCENRGINTQKGQFQANMAVELLNDGPVTILLDSKKTF
jgi:D-aminoacyl-tRNA deacylase